MGPTMLAAAGVDLGSDYVVDGRDMLSVLKGETKSSQHEVFLHYCGFNIAAARVFGRFKVFWKTPKWYANDPKNASVCLQCCNGVNLFSKLTGTSATELCGCKDKEMDFHDPPLVYDMTNDRMELHALSVDTWPKDAGASFETVVQKAEAKRTAMRKEVDSKANLFGAGSCTAGLSATYRQPCCPGCHATGFPFPKCSGTCDAPHKAPMEEASDVMEFV